MSEARAPAMAPLRFAEAGAAGRLSEALLQASRGCVKLLALDGTLLAVNARGILLLGGSDESELVGHYWPGIWPDAARPMVEQAVAAARRGEVGCFLGRCPDLRGEWRWWDVTVAPVRDADGRATHLLASSYDVTETKQREEVLRRSLEAQGEQLLTLADAVEEKAQRLAAAEARATHAEKLQLFGRFVGGIVHDFNNVLAAVHGATRLLQRRLTDPGFIEITNQMEMAVERGARLARQLLDFARYDDATIELFSPAETLRGDMHLLRHIVHGGLTLDVNMADEIWPVIGAPQRFQSVLFNLVANARDALGNDGKITVALSNCGQHAVPAGLAAGDYVCLRVTDTGCGMDAETLCRLGKPFFTTKSEGKGTGLGLASAFEFAEQCGGKVEIRSKPGAGTALSLYLRRAQAG